ncbi:PREDICTED: ankyrin repeat domain-containing protein 13C-like [Camelina sativa]|uniref:Ankyrin repeat domain-containing protein 13C-like n=1 Tax=Camelina sativa TaxID=90675 RepID=A0ABM0XDB2_CAMSA|nr:PREDICTED: ankyrin repeat domain-containing protein 13C-like [Camelina sativa]
MASSIDVTKYGHSPVHHAVVTRDYAGLKKLLSALPKMRDPSEVKNEAASVAEETKADSIASIIDRRDVVNRDTALHLAVKLGDETSAEMLMASGADWSLQNEHGWSALQEAICGREERIAMIIVRHYQPLAWAKWCRRLPRLLATMHRMRDFYMEITFHFESSVIPFISRVAPSDTYKIWKRGANLRADMTLAGFDGFRIQRSDQTILFLGDGSEDGKVPSGSLLMISHKDKEIMNALDGAGAAASEEEVRQEVAAMSKTSIFRPGIDVTQAVLFPQLTWRRQEKTEMVGQWKAKVYDMHNVVVSIKSRRVPGAMTDEELFSNTNQENDTESEDLGDILTEDEKKQLELALKLDSPEESSNSESSRVSQKQNSCSFEEREIPVTDGNGYCKQEKKGWFSGWRKREEGHKRSSVPPRSSLSVDEKVSDLLGDDDSPSRGGRPIKPGRHSTVETVVRDENRGLRDSSKAASTSEGSGSSKRKEGSKENEYKKGLRPVLWLSERFPLQTKELLPLLDILANKVKAIRRLRELMTTKLPSGTFPVKVAIPVIPTIRVLVTFTKFEELEAIEDEFVTPPSSPNSSVQNSPREETQNSSGSSSSWFQWIKTPSQRPSTSSSSGVINIGKAENDQDPFAIPRGYNWITSEEKKKKIQEKNKAKKGKSTQIS